MKKIDFFITDYHDYSIFINEKHESLNPRTQCSSFCLFCFDKIEHGIADEGNEKYIDNLVEQFQNNDEYDNLSSTTDKIYFLVRNGFFVRPIFIIKNKQKITVKCDLDFALSQTICGAKYDKSFAGFLVSCKVESSMNEDEIEEFKKQIRDELDAYNAYLNGEVYSIYDEDKDDFVYYFIYGNYQLDEAIEKLRKNAISQKLEPNIIEKRIFNKIVPAFDLVTSGIACYNALRHAEQMFFNKAFRLDDYRFYKNEDFTILVNNNGVLERQKVTKIIKGCIYTNDSSKPLNFKRIEFGELFKLYDLIFNNGLIEY